jgi:hypothetical protein
MFIAMDALASELPRTWLAATAKPLVSSLACGIRSIDFSLRMSSLNKANRSINR